MPIDKERPRYEIPGYAGYVSAIKPENLHAKTFGKLTYDISQGNYLKGQDLPPEEKYISYHTDTLIPPSDVLQRTAADIVGVDNKRIEVREPSDLGRTGPEVDQFTETREWNHTANSGLGKSSMSRSGVVSKDGKPYGTCSATQCNWASPCRATRASTRGSWPTTSSARPSRSPGTRPRETRRSCRRRRSATTTTS